MGGVLLIASRDSPAPPSVSCLAKVLRQAIEREERLMYELVLPGTEFKIMEVGVPLDLFLFGKVW